MLCCCHSRAQIQYISRAGHCCAARRSALQTQKSAGAANPALEPCHTLSVCWKHCWPKALPPVSNKDMMNESNEHTHFAHPSTTPCCCNHPPGWKIDCPPTPSLRSADNTHCSTAAPNNAPRAPAAAAARPTAAATAATQAHHSAAASCCACSHASTLSCSPASCCSSVRSGLVVRTVVYCHCTA